MRCRIFIYWSETWYIGSFFFTLPVEWEKERERERERKKERKKKQRLRIELSRTYAWQLVNRATDSLGTRLGI